MKVFTRAFAVTIIAAVLIFIFAYTAISKFFNFEIFRYNLSGAPLVGDHGDAAAVVLSVINLLPVALLLIPPLRKAGFLYCSFLLLLYALYLAYALLTAKHLPCSCSGIVPWLSWKEHLWVNILLMTLSITGYFISKRIIAITPLVLADTGNREC